MWTTGKRMRLNGWQRLGVVAAVLWSLGVVFFIQYRDAKFRDALSILTTISALMTAREQSAILQAALPTRALKLRPNLVLSGPSIS